MTSEYKRMKQKFDYDPSTVVEKTLKIKVVDHEATGAKFRKLRESYDWPLNRFAEVAGMSASFLSDLERGRRNWTQERWTTLAFQVMNRGEK